MDNTEQTSEQNIENIDSSSSTINTETSSHGLPEVTPAPRNTGPRGIKATLQEQEIARLQALLQAKTYDEQDIAALKAQLRDREHELTLPTSSIRNHDSKHLTCTRFSGGVSLHQFHNGTKD